MTKQSLIPVGTERAVTHRETTPFTLLNIGEKRGEREEKDYHLVERSFGSFARSVELPARVKPEDITAETLRAFLK